MKTEQTAKAGWQTDA